MTKNEAVERLMVSSYRALNSTDRKMAIQEIIDQIETEFTVRELVDLLGKVDKSLVSIDVDGDWALQLNATYVSHGYTIDSLKAKLTQLANPQPPSDKVTIQISRKLAELFTPDWLTGEMAEACREALKGTQP